MQENCDDGLQHERESSSRRASPSIHFNDEMYDKVISGKDVLKIRKSVPVL